MNVWPIDIGSVVISKPILFLGQRFPQNLPHPIIH